MTDSAHTYSIEMLVHYRCGACKHHWWSISNGPTRGELRCPQCGECRALTPDPIYGDKP